MGIFKGEQTKSDIVIVSEAEARKSVPIVQFDSDPIVIVSPQEARMALKPQDTQRELEQLARIIPITTMAADTIQRHNERGLDQEWEPLAIINEAQEALQQMPEGKTGLVLGSGKNTSSWREKGWQTLDIDPNSEADMITDANRLLESIKAGTYDYVFAECIRFDPMAKKGVGPARLLNQANQALRDGGILVIESANYVNDHSNDITLPDRVKYSRLMAAHGFLPVVQPDKFNVHRKNNSKPWDGKSSADQHVIYYGKKKESNFDTSRVQGELESLR